MEKLIYTIQSNYGQRILAAPMENLIPRQHGRGYDIAPEIQKAFEEKYPHNVSARLMSEAGDCPQCGTPFGRSHASINYCSDYCHSMARREAARLWAADHNHLRDRDTVEPEEKTCVVCEVEFTPRRSDAKYCSTKCRVAAHRAARAKQ